MNLRGKTVLITGASSGIGEATAKAFSKEGSNLVLIARSVDNLKRVANGLSTTNLVIPADITQKEAVKNLINQTLSTFNKIDILINNAGVGLSSFIEEMNVDDLRKLFEINVFAPLVLTQAVLPSMIASGSGKIINVSSMITKIVTSGSGGYRASKLALNGISDASRYELKKKNIQVVTVYPGLTATDFFKHSMGIKANGNMISKLRGRSPEFVSQKIIEAAKKDYREVYMSFISLISAKLSLLFPTFIETLFNLKTKLIRF